MGNDISILLNGESRQVPAGTGLLDLVESLGLPAPAMLVEYNGQALLRSEWAEVRLVAEDRLEVLRIVAGG